MALGFGGVGSLSGPQQLSPEVEAYARKIIACAQSRIDSPPQVLGFWLPNPKSPRIIRVHYVMKLDRLKASSDFIRWVEAHSYYWLVRDTRARWSEAVGGAVSPWRRHSASEDRPKEKWGDVVDKFMAGYSTGECVPKGNP